LRAAASAAADDAAGKGRVAAALRFEEQLDRWVDRCGRGAHPCRESPSMPNPIRTQTKADLLQRRVDINAELRKLRNKYDKRGAVEVLGNLERVEALAAERDQIEVDLERAASNAPRPL
jgi:hypothetical protein